MKFLFKTKIAIFLLLILVSAFTLQGQFLPTVHADETPSEETSPQPSPTPSPSPEPSVSPSPSPLPSSESETVNTQSDFCAQVITYACMDSDPSVCQEFATPCDVPAGWTVTSAPLPSPSPSPSPTPSPSPSPSPTPSPTPTLVTVPTVSIGTTYTGSNSNVKVRFNSINGSAGSLTISETTISASEVSQVGALSSTVYDISSSMSNGNFIYDLTLPVPAGVTVSNLKVLYASSVENLSNATQVSQSITDNGDGTFTIHNLNHFTVFVVVNPNTQANCDAVTVGTISGSTCFSTIQQAVNYATDNNSPLDSITVAAGTYNETVYVNKRLIIVGQGSPTVSGGFILQTTPVDISGFSGSTTETIASPTNLSLTIPVNFNSQTIVTLTGNGAANATVNYRIENLSGTPFVSGTGTVSSSGVISIGGSGSVINVSTLSDGVLRLIVSLSDTFGNSSATLTSTPTYKDTSVPGTPVVTSSPSYANATTQTSITVSGTGDTGTTVHWTIGSLTGTTTVASNQTYTFTTSVASLADGTLSGTIILEDGAGNFSSSAPFSIIKDTVAPTVSAGSNKVTNSSFNSVTNGASASDPTPTSNIASYLWSAPVAVVFSSSSALNTNISATSDGTYTVTLTVTDTAGNPTVQTFILTWDTTSPTASVSNSISVDGSNGWYKTNPTITLNSADALSGLVASKVRYAWDSTATATNGTVFNPGVDTTNVPSEGVHTLSIYAEDNAGNTYTLPNVTYKLDTVLPVTSDNTDSSWHNSAVTITLSCADSTSTCATTYYTTDGSTPTTLSSQGTTIVLSTEGQYTIKYFTVDAAVNSEVVKTAANQVKIDLTNPATNPGTPTTTPNPTNSTSQTWNWSAATDALSGVFQYFWRTMLGGVAGSNGIVSAPTTSVTTSLTQGNWDFFVYAKDNALNQSAEIQGSVVVDTTAPVTTDSGTDSLWHNSAVTVALNCSDVATGNSGCAATYYTTDGSTPTTSSSQGTSITLGAQGVYTIKYFTVDAAGNTEVVKTAANQVQIDTTNPATSANNVQVGWFTSNPTITLTAQDNGGAGLVASKVRYAWNLTGTGTPASATNGTVFTNGTQINIPGEGNYTLTIYAQDNAGNVTSSFSQVYKLDTVVPSTTDNVDNNWHNSTVTITLSCADSTSTCATTYYTTDGSTPTTASAQGTAITLGAEGTYTIKYFSVDLAGNTEVVKTASNQVKIDLTFPTTPATPSTTTPTNSTTQTWLWGTATDALSGVKSYSWRIAGGVSGTTLAGVTTVNTSLTQGSWTFYVKAIDNADNPGAESFFTVDVDTTAPVTNDNIDGLWHNSAVTITLSCSDNLSGCATTYYTTDGSNPTTASTQGTSIVLNTNGQFTIKYFTVDAAGNSETVKTATSLVKIDLSIPVISSVTLTNSTGNNSFVKNGDTVTLTATVTDNNQSLLTASMITASLAALGGGVAVNPTSYDNITGLATWTSLVVSGTTNGVVTVTVNALDVANNAASAQSVSPTADNTVPTTPGTPSTTNPTGLTTQVWNWTAAIDTGAGINYYQVSVDSGAYINIGNVLTYTTSLTQGSHTLTVRAVDNAGNTSAVSLTGNVLVDTTAPVTTDNTDSLWHNSAVTITLSCSDVITGNSGCATTYYTTDGSNPTTASTQGTSIVLNTNGQFTIKYFTVDAAGNSETVKTAGNTVNIDLTIPVISAVTLANTTTGNASFVKNGDIVNLTATVTDNNQSLLTASMITANLAALGGGVSVNPTTYNSLTGLATWANLTVSGTTNGVVTVSVNAVDVAANSATAATVTTTADNTSPTLSAINLASSNASPSLAKVGNTITLTFTSSETIQTPVVTIAGQVAIVSNVGNNWTATYLLTSTDTEGLINYQITFADLASNIGTPVSATSAITFDRTNPTASWTSPTALENVSGNVTLTASVTDTTGITSVTFMYQRNDGVDTFNPIATITASPFTSVWDTNSLTLDNYTLRMIVTDNAGNLTTLDQIVGVATVISSGSVISTSTTSSSVNIVWTTDDQTSSRVIYDTSSHPVLGSAPNYGYAQSTPVSDTSPKVTNHSVGLTGLSSSTTYYYRVVSAGSPESVSSEFSFTTSAQAAISSSSSVGSSTGPTGAPVCVDSKPSKAPVLLSARVSGKNEITLVWGKAGDPVTYYLLEYGTEHDHYQYGVANLGDVTSFIVKDLTPGQTYYFRVRGGNNCAPGEFSNELFAKADGSFIAQAVVETISAALGATSVSAKTQTTGSQVISLGGDFENQEFSIGSEATSSTLSASPALSLSAEASVTKKSNNRLLLAGTALVFILAGAISYAVAIRKGNKI